MTFDQQHLLLAGEQALLQKARSDTAAAFQREKAGLLNFHNELALGVVAAGWLEREKARLDRIAALEEEQRAHDRRIAQLKPLTGL